MQDIYLAFLDALCMYLISAGFYPKDIYINSLFIGGIGIITISSLLWMSGVVLNDIFDINKDKIEHPERVLVKGIIKPLQAWLVVIVLQILALIITVILFCVYIYNSVLPLLAICFLIGFIYIYNIAKNIKLFGVLTMGACRALNCIYPSIVIYDTTGFFDSKLLHLYFYSFLAISVITYLSYYEDKKFTFSGIVSSYFPLFILVFSFLLRSLKTIFSYDIILYGVVIVLFLIPSLIRRKIDVLALLHIYTVLIYLQSASLFHLKFWYINTLIVFGLLCIFFLRIVVFTGIRHSHLEGITS